MVRGREKSSPYIQKRTKIFCNVPKSIYICNQNDKSDGKIRSFVVLQTTSIRIKDNTIVLSSRVDREGNWYVIDDTNGLLCKPYLCPKSSMTEEEEGYLLSNYR